MLKYKTMKQFFLQIFERTTIIYLKSLYCNIQQLIYWFRKYVKMLYMFFL